MQGWGRALPHATPLSLLLARQPFFPYAPSFPLVSVLVSVCTGVVAALLRHKSVQVNAIDRAGVTPLHRAAACGHVAVVEALWPRGANLDAQDPAGRTPLHLAAAAGHAGVVGRLVIAGAQVQAVDRNGWTPAHLAAWNGEQWDNSRLWGITYWGIAHTSMLAWMLPCVESAV